MTQERCPSLEVAGTVMRITLKNFMCHSHLQVNLNTNITFICGKNGSGKSAILIALIIGLGGKSLDTNRSNNLKGFIKSGKSKAVIEITLNNVGENAYRAHELGHEITVIREITPVSSLFRLLSSNGKVVKRKRNELDEMLDQFKIQINNPISVLNQEMARSFMKTSTNKDLYKLYMKGTHLGQLEEIIHNSLNLTIPSIKKDIDDKHAELEFANKDLEEMRRKHEKKKELMGLEDVLKQLHAEYSWSSVYTAEKEVGTLKKEISEIQSDIDKLNRNITDKDGTEKQLLSKRVELSRELEEWKRKRYEYRNRREAAETDAVSASDKYSRLQRESNILEKRIQNNLSDVEKINTRLTALYSKNRREAEEKDRAAAQRRVLDQRVDTLKRTLTVSENDRRNLLINHQKKAEEVALLDETISSLNKNLYKLKERIQNLESNSSQLSCFADYMPRLVKEVEMAHSRGKFDRKPIGPLGQFIKLKESGKAGDACLGPAVEATLGRSLLCGFAVHSMRDSQTLRTIFEQLNINNVPEIIVSEFIQKVHDVRDEMVRHGGYISMLESLDISDPVVTNTLIDQREVELILLLPNNEHAYRLMEHIDSVPVNCARAVTPDSVFYPAPNYRCYHLTSHKTTSILQADKKSIIRNLKESFERLHGEVEKNRISMKLLKEEENDMKAQMRRAEEETRRITGELTRAEADAMKLVDLEEETSDEVVILKDEISFKKIHIDKDEKSLQSMKIDLEAAKVEYEKAEELKATIESDDSDYDLRIREIEEAVSQVGSSLDEFISHFDNFKRSKNEKETKLHQKRSSLAKKEEKLAAKTQAAALNSGFPIHQHKCREEGELKEEMSRVESDITAIREYMGDGTIKEITDDLHLRLEKVEQVRSIISETRQYLELLTENTARRKERFLTLRKEKSNNIKANFAFFSRLRNYEGIIVFDHHDKKLNIMVKTNRKTQEWTSVLNLSGGERSYSMVAFILALWKEMPLPFYLLDEFDVFMDPLNRHIVMKLLMMHARDNPHRQFVFFTPNDFEMDSSDDVNIFRMEDPRDDSLSQL